jgi:hypothetical protein
LIRVIFSLISFPFSQAFNACVKESSAELPSITESEVSSLGENPVRDTVELLDLIIFPFGLTRQKSKELFCKKELKILVEI